MMSVSHAFLFVLHDSAVHMFHVSLVSKLLIISCLCKSQSAFVLPTDPRFFLHECIIVPPFKKIKNKVLDIGFRHRSTTFAITAN